MATILSQSADAAFRCASQVMVKNGIVISSNDINEDMFDRAAFAQVKQFTPISCHAPFLQGMRESGRVGHIVDLSATNDKIDTRAFGNCRARYRSDNNNLKDDGVTVVSKPPSLFPTGKPTKKSKQKLDRKRVRDESEYFAAGPLAVTPQKIASTIDLTSMPDQTTDTMLYRTVY